MTKIRLTQAAVDKLASQDPPPKDVLYWDQRLPGFGVRQKAKSNCCSYVIQWRDPLDGRSFNLTLGRCARISLADAREIAKGKFTEIASGRNPIAERKAYRATPTFGRFAESYLASPAWEEKASTTRCGDQARIAHYLVPALGALRLTAITQAHVEKLRDDLTDPAKATAMARVGGSTTAGKRGGEGAARSVIRLLRAMLDIAVKGQLIATNPAAGVDLGVDGKRTLILDPAAYARLWRAIEELRAAGGTMAAACDIIALLAITGARKGEVRGLRWRHLDLARGEIRLPIGEHKSGRRTGKPRIIALSDAAVAILAGYQRGLPNDYVFVGAKAGVPVDLARPWKRIAEAAGVPAGIVPHSLRHGVGSALGDAGASLLEIASVLGHASPWAAERYCHAGDDARKALAQRASELVRPKVAA